MRLLNYPWLQSLLNYPWSQSLLNYCDHMIVELPVITWLMNWLPLIILLNFLWSHYPWSQFNYLWSQSLLNYPLPILNYLWSQSLLNYLWSFDFWTIPNHITVQLLLITVNAFTSDHITTDELLWITHHQAGLADLNHVDLDHWFKSIDFLK